MTKIKKNYSLELKGFDRVIIKTSRGNSNYYPYNELADFLEVSAEIDVNTIQLKTEFRDNSKIEWHYRLMRDSNDSLANWQGIESAERYSSAESIESAKNLIIKAVKGIKKIIKTGKLHNAYTRMAEIAKDYIKHYNSDFNYHDTLKLAELKNDDSFVWIVRNSGSWLLTENNVGCKQILTYCVDNNKHRQESEKDLFYWYNGLTGNLIQVADISAENYLNKL